MELNLLYIFANIFQVIFFKKFEKKNLKNFYQIFHRKDKDLSLKKKQKNCLRFIRLILASIFSWH